MKTVSGRSGRVPSTLPGCVDIFYANDIDHFGPLMSHDGEQVLAARIHNTAQGNVSFSFVVAPFDGSKPRTAGLGR